MSRPGGLASLLASESMALALPLERVFDDLPNVVFFIKDRAGRYLAVNKTLVERCAFADKARLVGRRPSDFFPAALAEHYERQDRRVLQGGKPVLDQLELHLYPDRSRGWCLTSKYPVLDPRTGKIAAIMGISRDVEDAARRAAGQGLPELARAIEVMQARIPNPPEIKELATICGLSTARFSGLVQRVFQLTPRQLAMKVRIDEALHLLTTSKRSLTDIALETGFCDQSAFTRHFRRMTGVPPGTFRLRAG
ncbi:MAG: AraC family transcriptional regulator [Chthoniobacter sp.]|uniref:helix-turn-helix domain-containing protein n=1 Tax=Chthoniobacter sp. TaxID=2510640 RepID=UPI0032A6145E